MCGIISKMIYNALRPSNPSSGEIWNNTNSTILDIVMINPDSMSKMMSVLYVDWSGRASPFATPCASHL